MIYLILSLILVLAAILTGVVLLGIGVAKCIRCQQENTDDWGIK